MPVWGNGFSGVFLACSFLIHPAATTVAAALFSKDKSTRHHAVIGVYLSPEDTCEDRQAFMSWDEELGWEHTDSEQKGSSLSRKHTPENGSGLDQDSEAPATAAS